MAHLPPPNNDLNVLEDEHAPAPEHAPIAPNPVPIQPNDYLADDDEEPEEEEEPIPEQAPAAPAGFASQWIGWHDLNNNNGWIKEDDEEEVEAEEEDEEEMEAEEDEDIEVEDNDDENDAEIIHPYEEADPLNRPPPSPIQLTLDSTLREQIQEMKKLIAELNEQFQQIQERDLRAENEMLRIRLRAAEEKAEYNYMDAEYYKYHFARMSWYYDDLSGWEVRDNAVRTDAASDRGGESVDTTAVVKDVREEKDDKGDDVAAKDPQPSESRRSPCDP
ncbi:hypothetical protein Tco_1012600 [Tanacetum coccineum]